VLCRDWRPAGLKGRPVLGIPEGLYLNRATAEMLEHFQATSQKLADAGYKIKSLNVMPDFDAIRERQYLITAAEAARVHKEWFPRFRDLYHPKTIELLERGGSISDEALAEALRGCDRLWDELTHLMDEHRIDLWISPSAPGPALKGLESTGDPVMNLPWTQVGFPALNLPSGRSADGLPLGLQLTARWHEDEVLLGWAEEVEAALSRQ
jgi:Asp-tRNA(Asn)/Glu-tRNA(Gln) amidotransferase A subunit family amidase